MSEYYKTLPPVAKDRYLDKLKVMGLEEGDDPYANDGRFVDDMTLWPPVEYGHIFCYFIQRPGVYTQQQLIQWKSLEAYNYFKSGHVREVGVWVTNKTSCFLMTKVNPSQSSPDPPHHAWIGVKSDGQIITAHCTCMAG